MSLKTHCTLLERSARPHFHTSVLHSTYYYYYYYYYYYTFEKYNHYVSSLINLIVCGDRPSNTEMRQRKYRDEAAEIQRWGYGNAEIRLRKYRDEAAEIQRWGYGNAEMRLLAEERESHCSIPGKGTRLAPT
jgi:hypothetical protein